MCHRWHKFGHKAAECRTRYIPGFVDVKTKFIINSDLESESTMNTKRRKIDYADFKYIDIIIITNKIMKISLSDTACQDSEPVVTYCLTNACYWEI